MSSADTCLALRPSGFATPKLDCGWIECVTAALFGRDSSVLRGWSKRYQPWISPTGCSKHMPTR